MIDRIHSHQHNHGVLMFIKIIDDHAHRFLERLGYVGEGGALPQLRAIHHHAKARPNLFERGLHCILMDQSRQLYIIRSWIGNINVLNATLSQA
ncbi:hypothetical protein D3C78_985710 [compost metagenome]